MEILIRPWRRRDLQAVRRILRESWMAAYSAYIPEEDLRAYHEETYRIESLAQLYANPSVCGFIGEADGKQVGFARAQFHRHENRLYLASLYLLPDFQKRGIGGRLLTEVETKALEYNLEELWVGVMFQNEPARCWYERIGFRFVNQEPFRIGRIVVSHLVGFKTIGKSE